MDEVREGESRSLACFARERLQVAEHAWLIHKPRPTDPPFEGNCVLFEQSRGWVVVDAGGCPESGRQILRHILEISAKPVSAIVYTHYHGDHNLGAGPLLERWPEARVISTEATRRNMLGAPMAYITGYSQANAGTVEFARQRLLEEALDPSERAGWERLVASGPCIVDGYRDLRVHPATEVFTEALDLPDSQTPLELRFLGRANTDGDAVVWAPRQKLLAAGDIVVHPLPYASACFVGEWIEVLERLMDWGFARLIPGHGEVQGDGRYLERLLAALRWLHGAMAPLAARGLGLEEARAALDLTDLRRLFVADGDGWERFLFGAVFLGDIVKNAWQEATGSPIVQGG